MPDQALPNLVLYYESAGRRTAGGEAIPGTGGPVGRGAGGGCYAARESSAFPGIAAGQRLAATGGYNQAGSLPAKNAR
jgi:hypothetical protein